MLCVLQLWQREVYGAAASRVICTIVGWAVFMLKDIYVSQARSFEAETDNQSFRWEPIDVPKV